jgi:hypothetical protein
MGDAARALDDVSDHLGEVLRHADELLAEWARFGGQVRTQVEREAAAIGSVVDGAVERAASAGIDRAIADRLRMLTVEIERIEQRARAASRVVTEQREADRRVLWVVVAGIVLANALLVVLLLRKPEPARVPAPIRMESTVAPPTTDPARDVGPAAGTGPGVSAGNVGEATPDMGSGGPSPGLSPEANAGSNVEAKAGASATDAKAGASATDAKAGSGATDAKAGSGATDAKVDPSAVGTKAGSNATGTKAGVSAPAATRGTSASGTKPAGAKHGGAGAARPTASPIVLPPKAGSGRAHKKP